MKFSNEYSDDPTVIQAVEIASSASGSIMDDPSIKKLTFNGEEGMVITSGCAVTSDPIAFDLEPREDLAITIHFGATPKTLPASRVPTLLRGIKFGT